MILPDWQNTGTISGITRRCKNQFPSLTATLTFFKIDVNFSTILKYRTISDLTAQALENILYVDFMFLLVSKRFCKA